MKNVSRFALPLLGLALLSTLMIDPGTAKSSKSEDLKNGEKTYMASCEACHMQGMNVIKPGKDIVVSTKISTVKEFKAFLSEKHGLMPSFEFIAEDDTVLRSLHKYVKTLKNQDWQYEPEGIERTPIPSKQDKKPGQANQNAAG